jgi:hypothetical protein
MFTFFQLRKQIAAAARMPRREVVKVGHQLADSKRQMGAVEGAAMYAVKRPSAGCARDEVWVSWVCLEGKGEGR